MMVDRKGARRIGKIRHSHKLLTPEQRQDDFNRAVEKVRSSDFSPKEQAHRIERLRIAHLGVNFALSGDIFTARSSK